MTGCSLSMIKREWALLDKKTNKILFRGDYDAVVGRFNEIENDVMVVKIYEEK